MPHDDGNNKLRANSDGASNPPTPESEASKEVSSLPYAVTLRAVSHNGVRHSLKLETIFWEVLSAAATAEKTKIGNYIGNALAQSSKGLNKSSFLRSFAAEWLRNRLAFVMSSALSRKSLVHIAQTIPSPCFVINTHQSIEVHNEAFRALLQTLRSPDAPGDPSIKITFQSNIQTVQQHFHERAQGFFPDTLIVQVGERRSKHNARVALLQSLNGKPGGLLAILTD